MKQLVRYFLFFVCASLVFIQCARIFPSGNNLPAANLPARKTVGNELNKRSPARSSYSTPNWLRLPATEKSAFHLYFTEQAFPLNMLKYINHYQFLNYRYWSINENKIDKWQLFYNPYTNFVYMDLFDKSDSRMIANNPFDRKK